MQRRERRVAVTVVGPHRDELDLLLNDRSAAQPGVYVMVAAPKDADPGDDVSSLATQWFIVSDIGITTVGGEDGGAVHGLRLGRRQQRDHQVIHRLSGCAGRPRRRHS